MAHYTGSTAEGARARTLAHEREEQQAEFKRKQEEIKKANTVKLLDMSPSTPFRSSRGATPSGSSGDPGICTWISC